MPAADSGESHYYPFGMLMPGRSYTGGGEYRYGFNGKENDNEAKGTGVQQDYGMRIYDTRLGKFLSVDPLQQDYPELTPYQFASNSPIANIDLDGLERHYYMLVRNGPGGWYKPTLQLIKTESFTETTTKWTPTLTNWFKTTSTTTTNPRNEYIVVGQVYVASGLDGTQVTQENTQWTFSSEADMNAAEKHGGPSNYGGWNWANSDHKFAFAFSIGMYNALQAEAETPGGVGPGLGSRLGSKFSRGVNPSAKVNNTATAANGGNTAAAEANAANKVGSNGTSTPLNWSRVNKQGQTATEHVNLHSTNNIKKDFHGIFSGDPITQTNNAWNNKGNIQPVRQTNGNDMYIIPSPNAGTEGGSKGSGATLNNITIITVGGTNTIVTSYPSK